MGQIDQMLHEFLLLSCYCVFLGALFVRVPEVGKRIGNNWEKESLCEEFLCEIAYLSKGSVFKIDCLDVGYSQCNTLWCVSTE